MDNMELELQIKRYISIFLALIANIAIKVNLHFFRSWVPGVGNC